MQQVKVDLDEGGHDRCPSNGTMGHDVNRIQRKRYVQVLSFRFVCVSVRVPRKGLFF